ncbi:MAG: PKD domain-containing protein [Bacteroidota bacterium]
MMSNFYSSSLLLLTIFFGLTAESSAQCDFSISNQVVCGNTVVNFSVDSPGAGVYSWDFQSDSNVDAYGTNVTFVFPGSAVNQTYTVVLYRNSIPCEADTVYVQAVPDSEIGLLPGSGIMDGNNIRVCSALPQTTLSIFNASTTYSSNASYEIDWGDGTIENFDNTSFPNTGFITHDYNQFGYYNIRVTTTGVNGCVAHANYVFYNGSNPSVGLANPGNTVGLCAPAAITFPITNTADNPVGTEYYVYVSGELVDSFTQSNVPPAFTYLFEESSCGASTSTGNYQNAFDVQVVATNPCGSSQATIEPIEISEPPEPEFEVDRPVIGCTEDVFTITDVSTNILEVTSGNPSNCSTNLAPSWVITPGVAGIDWNLLSGNLFNAEVLELQFLLPGDYTIEMTIHSEACGDYTYSQTIEVLEIAEAEATISLATASFPAISDECAPTVGTFINESTGDSIDYVWTILPASGWSFVDSTNLTSEHLNIAFEDAGTYTVFLTTSNLCSSDTWDTTLVIAGDPIVDILPIPTACESTTLNFNSSNVLYDPNGGTLNSFYWSFPGGIPSSSTDQFPSNIQYNTPGTYTITLTTGNQCGASTITETFTIQAPGTLIMPNDTAVCAYSPAIQLSTNFSGGNWSGNGITSDGWFVPDGNNLGSNTLVYTILDGACSSTDSMIVTVIPAPPVDAGPDQEVCVNDAPFVLTGYSPANGTWSISSGGVLTGGDTFDPVASGPGTYTLTYTFADNNGCNNFDEKTILVNILPTVEAGPDQSICENPNDIPLTGFSPTGGIWSGTGVSPDGLFNVQNTPGLGSYTLYYTYTDPATGCANLDSINITVVPNDVADAGIDELVCINDNPFLLAGGTPAGGAWSGTGVDATGIFDPSMAGVGIHVLTYRYGSGYCETTDSKLVEVQGLPQLTLPSDRALCVSAAPLTLNALPINGTWSGIGVSGNTFDPQVAGVGSYELAYTYTDPLTNCSNSDTMNVVVNPLPVLSARDTLYCNTPGAVALPTPDPAGGLWSGPGVIGDQFDPQVAGGVGTYSLTYTFVDGNACENSTTIDVQVIDPSAIDAGVDQLICIDASLIDLSQLASPSGGTWSANGSGGLTGELFNPKDAGLGVHILTYTIGSGNCQVSDNIAIDIRPLPTVEAGPPVEICADEPIFDLSGYSPSGGLWTGPGITDPASGTFDPGSLNPDDYQLTYTFTDAVGCTSYDSLPVTIHPLPVVFAGNDTTFCDAAVNVYLESATPTGGIWSGPGIVGPSSGAFNPQIAGGEGTYTLVYEFTDPVTGCENTDTLLATVIAPADIEAGPDDTICIDQGLFQLTGQSQIAGTWTGRGIVDETAGTFDPMIAGGGTHILYFTYGVGSCLVRDFKRVRVIDLRYVNAGPNEELCYNEEPITLTGQVPADGIWSGPGIIDPFGGVFDPERAQAGQHVLTYTFTDPESGCVSSSEKIITVFPIEQPDFLLPEIACRNELINFTNLSPVSYRMFWDFGDGRSSTAFEPQHSYANAGTYQVTLTVINDYNCTDTVRRSIIIADNPVAYFEPDTSEACAGIELSLSNQSVGFDLTYEWELGNGLNSSERDPGVIFLGQGLNDTTYIITLTVTNICGTSSFQEVVTVHPLPVARFSVVPESDCSPITMNFANNTIGAATDFFWDFGNGNTSTEAIPPPQVYTTDSLTTYYDVTLIASNICGSDTLNEQIEVAPADVQAFFEVSNDRGCMPLTVEFYNFATPGATIDWDFGDGNSSPETSPVHTFTEAGEYEVIQYASSTCGYDSVIVLIEVLPEPEVSFEHNRKVCWAQEVTFENTSVDISGHFWDFGDGDTSNLRDPVHVYDSAGTYTVTLRGVSRFNQCEAFFTSQVTVLEPPYADFEPSTYSGCVPLSVDFTNASNGAMFYTWEFGDGNTGVGTNPTHVYSEVGNYDVRLIASDEFGCTNDTTKLNIIVNPIPTAGFEYQEDALCQLPAVVVFTNTSEGADAFTWEFGDGSSANYNNPNHTYTEGGDYRVRMFAINQYGCRDTSIADLSIFPSPVADFELDNQQGCSPVEVSFTNNSIDANLFHWDFGDGTTSSDPNPTHVFDSAGWHAVKLVASVDGVCYDSIELANIVQVFPQPHANFEPVELIIDNSPTGTFDMLNYSTNASEYFWDFGDGETSEVENPRHRYLHNGNYQVYLEASNEHGCVDDTLVNIIPEIIKGLFVPNALSPESGIGDVRVWRPSGIGLKEYKMQIFSPYGQLLWESQELDADGRPLEAWDGTYQGKLLPQDVYVWKGWGIYEDGSNWIGVKGKNGQYKTMGSVILLR